MWDTDPMLLVLHARFYEMLYVSLFLFQGVNINMIL